ncbi:MAG TPA: winged helix-turn-helix domain-containing protein, partial [Bryobacteraceae bacterium]
MPGVEQQYSPLRFGVFELNLRARELLKRGIKIKLQEQPFRLLALLLEHPGEVVTREQLRSTLWPEDTFVDFEHSVNAAVAKLRQALGDSAENPRFIETVPRRGYRFIAPVSAPDRSFQSGGEIRSGEVSALPAEAPPTIGPHRPRSALWLLSGGAIFLLLLIGAALWFFGLRPEHPAAPPSVAPLTSSLGLELDPCFSPDGNQVAYIWNGPRQDNLDIYVKLIGGGEPLRLTTDPAPDLSPAWSPDGRQIAFVRHLSEEKSVVMLVPALGGVERKLMEIPNSARAMGNFFPTNVMPPRMLAWSPDGEWLVVAEASVAGGATSLLAYSMNTGERRTLTVAHSYRGDLNPAFAPDGSWLAFSSSQAFEVSDLYLLPL